MALACESLLWRTLRTLREASIAALEEAETANLPLVSSRGGSVAPAPAAAAAAASREEALSRLDALLGGDGVLDRALEALDAGLVTRYVGMPSGRADAFAVISASLRSAGGGGGGSSFRGRDGSVAPSECALMGWVGGEERSTK
jgi:hypothetical protein